MRFVTPAFAVIALALSVTAPRLSAQNPPPTQQGAVQQQQQQRGAPPPAGQRGGGGRGRGVQVMTLSTTAWLDGGTIPFRYTQAGEEVSPVLTWSEPPENVQSFVLIVHDIDATNVDGTTDTLHWMVWNIPATARGLPERVPQGAELPDGSRQISATGPYYRGPAAPASGPDHHYVFDLFALDAMVDVKAVGQTVAQTRAAVVAAMAGHVRAKASLVGRFRYPQ